MYKPFIFLLLALAFSACSSRSPETSQPSIAFSFDDGNPQDILNFKGADWNGRIRDQLKKYDLQAVWFVCAQGVDNEDGKQLLRQWNEAGHLIANHTYNHPNLDNCSAHHFIQDLEACTPVISSYSNYCKLFRFPYLKAGNTAARRDSLRTYLKTNGYRQGWVTVDASDWYVNSRMLNRLKENPLADLNGFREFYLQHILDRARYYNRLSLAINHRQITHTVLLHFNLTTALFLSDLIERFKKEGWNVVNYSEALKDPIYRELPTTLPSEQSLIWMLARQTGRFEKQLRYPGEDGIYEKAKMDRLGL